MAASVGYRREEQASQQSLAQSTWQVSTRPVDDGDAQLLLRIYASARDEEMALLKDWSEEQRQHFLEMQLLAQRTAYDARYPGSDHRIILLEDCAAGHIWVARSEGEIRLLDIALLSEYRQHGIGTTLLRELQNEASERGKILRHCVHKDNAGALAFYRKLKFAVCGDLGMHFLMEWNS